MDKKELMSTLKKELEKNKKHIKNLQKEKENASVQDFCSILAIEQYHAGAVAVLETVLKDLEELY